MNVELASEYVPEKVDNQAKGEVPKFMGKHKGRFERDYLRGME